MRSTGHFRQIRKQSPRILGRHRERSLGPRDQPFRSEAEAYRFLLLTVGYFAAIAIAALAIGKWAGLVVFVGLTLAGLVYVVRARRGEPRQQTVPRAAAARTSAASS